MFRIMLGLLIAGGAIWYSFQERTPSKFSPKVVGGYEVSEQTAADPLAIPLPQITQLPPKPLTSDVQKVVSECLSRASTGYDEGALRNVKSLETLRGLVTSKIAPASRLRTREAITFQTADQIRNGTKYRALYAPLETGVGAYGWKLFTIATDGLPDPEKLPDLQPEAKKFIADLLRKGTVTEHDRDELLTWENGSTAEVKMQDQRISELTYHFEGKLLGCMTAESEITCKCL